MDDNRSREPLLLAAGDTVCFRRFFRLYPANQGWTLEYTGIGGGSQIVWNSTVDADGVSFDINVTAATTAQYIPGDYDLEGWAANQATGQRFRVYFNNLKVAPNLQVAQPDLDVRTHAQKMLDEIEATLLKMAKHDLNDSSTEGVEIRRKRLQEATDLRDKYLRERENELAKEAAIAGKPSRKNIRARLMVTLPGVGLNSFGAGNEQGNFFP